MIRNFTVERLMTGEKRERNCLPAGKQGIGKRVAD